MNRYRSLILSAIALVVLVIIVICATCQRDTPQQDPTVTTAPLPRQDKLIGICLPAGSDAWTIAGNALRTQLTDQGYRVELVYGDGTAKTQNTLLLELINKQVHCIVISAVDSAAMAEAESAALAKNIPILSYGSLLMDTEAVKGYICYDYFEMGASIARYIETSLALASAEKENRSYTVELFMGAPEDYHATLLHKGIMSVLEPHLQNSTLESKSHRTAFEDSCIIEWSEATAEKACASRLKNSYAGTAPDVCICASDNIAAGVLRALEKNGTAPENMPLITGNGATEKGLQNLADGKQALTVRTDPADPAVACCAMVDMVLFGIQPDFAVSEIFNNVTNVPTALCGFTLVYDKQGE